MDIIDFLERIGKDAELRYASEMALARALNDAHMSPPAHAALLSGGRGGIEAVLNTDNNNVCCMVFAPTPEGEAEESDKPRQQEAA
jgi:hypothetical protein